MDIWEIKKNNQNSYVIKKDELILKCQIGFAGIADYNKKIEGDKKTPAGEWSFKRIFYRSDRIDLGQMIYRSVIPLQKITKNCGWCDDKKSKKYNQYIKIKEKDLTFPFSYEKLWRDDKVYDLFIELDYNNQPVILNKGSAIFIHCSFKDYRPTSGCIAIHQENLIDLVQNIKGETKIIIN